ncbi:four-carbon acid sugar kinase family protein [Streptomyces sp. 5-6(2022)]|uniref:four-carbon acid sugar kinase family protein n=1 Tax=Streptomyces sp. 5-6(2022) TaxID=2936510 RepID=UPI0023B9939F|nr:four-carbon acid sugar kinase family protein [Streptomyces sp. 5-6(2022)]
MTPSRRLLAIADDLSGAAEVAAAVCSRTTRSRVLLLGGPGAAGGMASALRPRHVGEATVLDLDSRYRPAAEAAEAVRGALREALRMSSPDGGMSSPDGAVPSPDGAVPSPDGAISAPDGDSPDTVEALDTVVLKKIDSLLRGNVAAEIAALAEGGAGVVLTPALPIAGRVVRSGVVHIGGVPLHEGDAWRAETVPPPASVAQALGGLPTALIPLTTVRSSRPTLRTALRTAATAGRVAICDAETDADLDAIVEASLADGPGMRLVGSGGLALAVGRHLARSFPAADAPAAPSPDAPATTGPAAPGVTDPAAPGVTDPAAPGVTGPAAEDAGSPATTDPATPSATAPATPSAPDPAAPGATGPAAPDATSPATTTDPATPSATDPAAPGATGPAVPDATDPAAPDATSPATTTDPATPSATDPAPPGATDPATPSATDPAAPRATGPAAPDATSPAATTALATPSATDPAAPRATGPAAPDATSPAATTALATPSATDPAPPGATGPAAENAGSPAVKDAGSQGLAGPGATGPATTAVRGPAVSGTLGWGAAGIPRGPAPAAAASTAGTAAPSANTAADPDAGAPSAHTGRPVLVVVGTAEPGAVEQVRRLVEDGAGHQRLPLAGLLADGPPVRLPALTAAVTVVSLGASPQPPGPASAYEAASQAVAPASAPPSGGAAEPVSGRRLVLGLARAVEAAVAAHRGAVDLVLTGGETARRVLDALAVTELDPVGQVHHGAVHLRTPDGQSVVTRPGSFGDPDSLRHIVQALRPHSTERKVTS